MDIKIKKAKRVQGEIQVPGSKSQMVRGLILGLLAKGRSSLSGMTESEDVAAAERLITGFGARVEKRRDRWEIIGGELKTPSGLVEVGNSGITARFGLGLAGLVDGSVEFDCGDQLKTRPIQPLVTAYKDLGLKAEYSREEGRFPLRLSGTLTGGWTTVPGITSQFISGLLMICPKAAWSTTVRVENLREKPYVAMTGEWLDRLGVRYENRQDQEFEIEGGQEYQSFDYEVPGDYSAASSLIALAAVSDSTLILKGLRANDLQPDRRLVGMVKLMGASVEVEPTQILVRGGQGLTGGRFDLGECPDLLPAAAVLAAAAAGRTVLSGCAQARIKESDRIGAMARELSKMGIEVTEKEDGLEIAGGSLKGVVVDGHGDHRVIMALTVAGLLAEGETIVQGAEGVAKTYPDFFEKLKSLGIEVENL